MAYLKNKKHIIVYFFTLLLFVSSSLRAQLTTSTTMTPTQLVQNILLGGGLTANNITYSGSASAIGSFDGTLSNIGFTAGIIMASGDIANAIGPNNTGSTSANFSSTSFDPQLSAIASGTVNDAAILEFDFVPTSDTIKFRYVFGSEEYMEFANSSFNDVFGFFISGANPTGGTYSNQNIAFVPGTGTAVSINNVNLGANGQFYFDNGNGNGSGTAPDGSTVQYDGFTVPLTATAAVVCGQTYHIKIAIADVGDGSYDSGVFLEAGSFSSTGTVFMTSSTNFGGAVGGNDTTIYEGCGFASVIFGRSTANLSVADTLYYTIGGTATMGVDYVSIDNNVIFAPGQDTAYVTIISIPDALIEGTETVTVSIYLSTPCNGSDTIAKTLSIIDSPPLTVHVNNDTSLSCPFLNLPLKATAAGGVALGHYNYSWTNSSSTKDTTQVNPLITTTYKITVTDSCGNTASDSAIVNIVPYIPLHLTFNNDTTICGGKDVLLHALVSGGSGNIYTWQPNISTKDTITVSPQLSSSYAVTISDDCNNSASDHMDITVYPINADFGINFSTNQTVQLTNLSSGAIQYYWNFGDASEDSVSTESNPEHFYVNNGTFTIMLVAVNQQGCADTAYRTVEVLSDFYFYFPNSFTPNHDEKNEFFKGYGAGIKSYQMRIYDRWGEKVFESADLYTGWDGIYKGKKAPADTYVVIFELKGFRHESIKKTGLVNLIR